MSFLSKYSQAVSTMDPVKSVGHVDIVSSMLIESVGPDVLLGEICAIQNSYGGEPILAEVIGIKQDRVQLMPYTDTERISVNSPVYATGSPLKVAVGDELLGEVLDAQGRSRKATAVPQHEHPILNTPPSPLSRPLISEQLATGVRAIDGLLSVGKGQRVGIFSGSGVGKSTLLGMIARKTAADVNVIALIGERGREVREFIEQNLGEEGMRRSVVVVSTSDEPALARFRAAFVAVTIAEYFRDSGKDVLLLFDSITRFARAQREIGLARGEVPAFRGFPPSVDAVLPKLLERCGMAAQGSITAFINILVEGDDLDEPISDAMRGILDGHIVLSRDLAKKNHFPAIDILNSVSRLAVKIVAPRTIEEAGVLREALAEYEEARDIIQSGIYVRGSNEKLDAACDIVDEMRPFLVQSVDESTELSAVFEWIAKLSGARDEA